MRLAGMQLKRGGVHEAWLLFFDRSELRPAFALPA